MTFPDERKCEGAAELCRYGMRDCFFVTKSPLLHLRSRSRGFTTNHNFGRIIIDLVKFKFDMNLVVFSIENFSRKTCVTGRKILADARDQCFGLMGLL